MVHRLARERCNLKVGQRFTHQGGLYEIRGAIGDGAAGLVRKVRDVNTGTTYAAKFLAPDPKYIDESSFDDVEHRFRREGERGRRLSHYNLVQLVGYEENHKGAAFEAGDGPSNPFVLMEYVDGRTLQGFIQGDPFMEGDFCLTQERLGIAAQIASALEYLHTKKLIHRDVKPSNIFLSHEESPKPLPRIRLGDFGVMKWGDFQASVSTGILTTTSQKGLGTLKYMSPEQATRPKDVTVKSDIFSLGITLYELFTARILFSPHHVYEIVNARRSRGNTASRFSSMGVGLELNDEGFAELILEMFLAISGRPTIRQILGRIEWEYERRYGNDYNLYVP